MRGVSGGEGERLSGRRMDGRNLRSRRRRGAVTTVRVPIAELAGEIKGVGEPAVATSLDTPRRERRARWKEALRRFRRRSQRRAKHTRSISARTEHTAIAALPWPVRLLPDVVVPPAEVGLAVSTGCADVGPETTTAGVGFACVAVVVIRGVGLAGAGCGAVCDWGDGAACGTCIMEAEQGPCVSVSVLHWKSDGGGPGSKME